MPKIKTKSVLYVIGGILCAVFLSSASAFAEQLDYEVNVQPSMTVTIPTTTVQLDIDPATAEFNSQNLSVSVGTNNPTGFTLTMSADDTSLTRQSGTDTIPTLDPLDGGYTEDSFTVNRWGYKLATTNYLPFAKSIELDSNDGPTNNRTSTVTFGAKANIQKPAGAYKLEIDFTAVANYVPEPADFCAGSSYDCMQEVVASTCTTTATDVIDRRDGNVYKIQRLADGKCWMLDNLRLDLVATDQATLQGNTNASSQTLDYLKNEGGRSAGNNYATAGVSYWTSDNSYSAPLIAIKNASDTEGTGWNPNTTTTSYGSGSGKIGVYYNYCAASAGSYCYGNGASQGTSVGDAGEDICPAGWRMPTGGANTVTTDGKGEYQALYTAYSSNATDFRNALSTPLSGYFYSGSAYDQGSLGLFWSSTRSSGGDMCSLYVDSFNLIPQNDDYRDLGDSVRCLLQ